MNNNITINQMHFKTINALYKTDIAYNIVLCCRISNKLDQDRLFKSWNTVFQAVFGALPDNELKVVSMSSDSEAKEYIQKLSNQKFFLENTELPLEARLINLDDNLNYFCIIQHHILIDLHSKHLLSRAISELYNTNKLSFELTDYKANSLCIFNIDFWKNQIKNEPSPLLLPSEKSERGVFTGDGETLFADMPDWVASKLKLVEDEFQFQEFIVLLTSYAVLLSKLCGQEDFFIGIPFPNRKDPEREYMYGPFVNILPLRVQIENADTFASLYIKIRKQMLLLNRNQDAPFLEILKLYKGQRDIRIPFFIQVGFTKEDPFNLNLKDVECISVDIRPDGAQMDLFFTYWIEKGKYRYRWEFNSNAFSQSQVTQWKDSYELILGKILENPDENISNITLLSDEYIKRFYSDKIRDYPVKIALRRLLEQSRIDYADLIAISDNTRSYSYKQFDHLVKKYSTAIISRVGTSKFIAVSIDNSIERIILIHSIVNTGNIYIPIDPNWPVARVCFILKNAGASLAVIEKRNSGVEFEAFDTVFIDYFNTEDNENLVDIIKQPHDPFAVLYTSGSTGNPKGVEINGNGLVNRIFWMQEVYPLIPGDTILHKVPFTFDVSMWEIFWPFLTGASLFIPEPAKYLDDEYLAEIIRHRKIKYVHFVPSLLKKFLNNVSNTLFPDLSAVICSGEALEVPLLKQFFEKVGNKQLHNLYGPTEASIDVTAWTCNEKDIEANRIPIGYPIANTRIYILDKYRKLCLPYVKGEIAISGINVSSGYLNDSELTSRVFIEGDWGFGFERIYLTGDLGFYSAEGVIFYDGRKDTQVKINGIRIELAEIERQLEALESVRTAVVMIPGKSSGDLTINAYLKTENVSDVTKIKKELSKTLPGYMIPSNMIIINEFPLLASGKIDRKALSLIKPQIDLKKSKNSNFSEGMIGEIQLIWASLLKTNEIPFDVSFFDLGGHSQLLPDLKKQLDKLSSHEIALIDLLNYPTVQLQEELLLGDGVKGQTITINNENDKRKLIKRAAERNRQRRRN